MKFSTMDGIRQNLEDWKKVGKVDSEMLFDQLPMEELGADGMDDLLQFLQKEGIEFVETDMALQCQKEIDKLEQVEQEASESDFEDVRLDSPLPRHTSRRTSKPSRVQVDTDDDSVRAYLRRMGNFDLLSKSDEQIIAKRIQRGEEMLLGSIFITPYLYFECVD